MIHRTPEAYLWTPALRLPIWAERIGQAQDDSIYICVSQPWQV